MVSPIGDVLGQDGVLPMDYRYDLSLKRLHGMYFDGSCSNRSKPDKGKLMSRNALLQGLCGLLIGAFTCGCVPLGVTAAGIGGGTAVSHTLGGITYRTFTASGSKVKSATLVALRRMDIKVISTTKDGKTEILKASASGRDIEIQLEPLSTNTTRMRVTAKSDGILYDSATATEIILQTERVMGGDV